MAQNLSNLPIGAKVKFGKHSVNGEMAQDIIWLVVAKNHTGYPSNSVTLLTEKIIDLRAIDAIEPNNSNADIRSNGNNTYGLSNINLWLNRDGTSWYTATHSNDQAPDNSYTLRGTGYNNRPGFLNGFNDFEKNAILTTSIVTTKYSYTTELLERKVFLPSATEVGETFDVKDGSLWSYFVNNSKRATLTSQCFNNSLSSDKPTSITAYWMWWLRSAAYNWTYATRIIDSNGNGTSIPSCRGDMGVRPALNLSANLSISDTTDSEGCYTFNWNSAPPVPTKLTVPTVYGGKSTNISWSSVVDPDGDSVTYQLDQSIMGGEYTNIYSGTNLSYSTVIPYGSTTVRFRVRAVDSLGATSGYIQSTIRTVINNNAPTISGSDGSLGVKTEGFSYAYTINDAESNTVTVTETIDGTKVRSYVATLNANQTFNVLGSTWLSLPNGTHTMTVTATDGIDSSVRTVTFTKSVNSFTILTNPMTSATRPARIKVNVVKNIPPEATFKVEVCNNGNDSSPTWEDATSAMNNGLIHLFSNTTKTATNWGVRIRVTVNRNTGSGACYVSSIGGNFE